MATSGSYFGVAYNFTYAIPKGSDPTSFYVGTFAAGEVKVSKRTGSGAISTANIASSPTAGSTGLMNISLSATEMQADEVTVEFIPVSNDFAARAVSIVTSNLPTPADVLEVNSSSVTGVADFKADVSGLATSASIAALNDFDPANDTVANVTTVGSVSGSVGSISGITFPTGFSSLTVSAVADGVWDEAQSGHTTVGTFGYYLDDQISGISGGGGTDWTATEKNQIRYRLGVDGTTAAPSVNSPDLATQASVDTVDANVDAILVDTGTTLPAQISGVETKVDTVDANVDAILVDTGTTIPGTIATVDANVDAILVDTGTTLPAQISGVETKVDTVDANVDAVLVDTGTTIPGTIATVDANVDAILVDTGTTLPATLATIEGKVDTVDTVADAIKVDTASILADTGTDGVVISTAQAQSIADEVLKRSVSTGEATAAEHSLATIVLAILESSRSSTTWTIKRTDGTTTHFTKTLTLDANADPVTGIE